MAIAKQGINGPFSGKVGAVVGYELNGQNVMRSVGKRTKPFTPLELLNQAKMKSVSQFLGNIKSIVKFGFQREAPKGSRVGAFQLAQAYHRKHAIALDGQNIPYIDPEKVLFSKGLLSPPLNCSVKRDGNRLELRWDYLEGAPGDRLMVLAYDGKMFRVFRDLGAERQNAQDSWEIEFLHLIKEPVYVYAAFRDTWHDVVSDSVYCGTIYPEDNARKAISPSVSPTGQLGLLFPEN